MKKIDNILNKDITKLIYKERQLIIDYFRKLVNDEFYNWKNLFIQKSKNKIFKRAYLIDAYDNIEKETIKETSKLKLGNETKLEKNKK